MLYSRCKSLNDFVRGLVQEPNWTLLPKKSKHYCLRHASGYKLPIPFSPSDRRAVLNFKADARRLEAAHLRKANDDQPT